MKKIVALVLAAAFLCSAGSAFAAKVTCTVDGIEGDKVTMTCEDADKIKAGDKVKLTIKSAKKIEGC
jgi:hypothetical protein